MLRRVLISMGAVGLGLQGSLAAPPAEPAPLSESVLRAIVADTGIADIDVELVRHRRRPQLSEEEIQRWIDERVAEIYAGIGSDVPPEDMTRDEVRALVEPSIREAAGLEAERIIRQRWRIAQSGAYRIDQTIAAPGDEAKLQGEDWEDTYIVPGDRASGETRSYYLDYRRKHAVLKQGGSVWLFEDWRLLGSPGMIGKKTVDVLRLLPDDEYIGPEPPRLPIVSEAAREKLREVIKLLSVESNGPTAAGRKVDRVAFSRIGGERVVEFVVDSGDPRRCYEIRRYLLGRDPARTDRCDDFKEIGSSGILYPRRAEIVKHRDGEEIERQEITVRTVAVNIGIDETVFDAEKVVPAGWTVFDNLSSPGSVYTKK